MKNLILMLTLTILCACGKSNLPDFNKLEKLRILAFQTPTPEVNPGATVTLNPIISDINATAMTHSASACIDPGVSYGAEPTCVGNPTQVIVATNVALSLPGAAESWTGLANAFNVTVPIQAVIFAGRTAAEQFNGVSYLVEYTLTNNLGQTERAIKRIIVSIASKTAKNQNPNATNIFANGAALTTLALGSEFVVTTDLTIASAEGYNLQNSLGSSSAYTETLTTTWFTTDGKTKYFRSSGVDSNTFTAPDAAPAGRSIYLMAVTRDDRGGVNLVKKKL
ncbi:MAG: hypothetical protein H7061_05090 [Bdellovibrionaceae bacterium]|nr:hypothetical protein [Bdellovibrio sp.]